MTCRQKGRGGAVWLRPFGFGRFFGEKDKKDDFIRKTCLDRREKVWYKRSRGAGHTGFPELIGGDGGRGTIAYPCEM